MENISYNGNNFSVGMRIVASDGSPRPPDRFNRKLADWKNRNFSGYISEISEPREPYQPHGGLVVKRDDVPDRSWIQFNFHHVLGGRVNFLPEAKEEAA